MTPASRRVAASIGRAGPFDLDVLAGLHAACFDEAWRSAALGTLLAMPGSLGLIGLLDGLPRGFLLARRIGEEAEILSLCVIPAVRRHGLASALLHAGFERLVRDGATQIFLEVAETNDAARALYGAHGFSVVGRRPDYYRRSDGERAAALVLARPLPIGVHGS